MPHALEITYKQRCERVCEALGVKLSYAKFAGGFTYLARGEGGTEFVYEMPDVMLERLESLVNLVEATSTLLSCADAQQKNLLARVTALEAKMNARKDDGK